MFKKPFEIFRHHKKAYRAHRVVDQLKPILKLDQAAVSLQLY